jgi:hypothetical protein
MRGRWTLGVVLAAAALSHEVGCIGTIGSGDGTDGDGNSIYTEEEMTTGVSPLRRLTRLEYENTLRDLFGDAHVDALTVELAGLPSDVKLNQFSTMALGVTTQHVDGYFFAADALSDRLSQDSAALGALEPCLATPPYDGACLGTFFDGFGRRLLRRPVTAEERTAFEASYAAGAPISEPDGAKLMLLHMLVSPAFLYRLELGGASIEEGIEELDGYALATRLSYLAWGSTPDEELLDAAASGALAGDGLDAQIDRLFGSERARGWVARFFDEWLGINAIPNVQQSDEFLAGIARDTLVADAQAEARALIDHHVFGEPASFVALMNTRTAFVTSPALAQLYGIPLPSGDGRVELDDTRAGLLSRAAMLMGQGEITHPVLRGTRVRRKLLCDNIEPPDPEAFPPNTIAPPPFDPNKTARDAWTAQTSAPTCNTCHARINAIGFALENYDAIGRYRTLEPIVDPDTGEVVNELPIDDQVEVLLDDKVMVDGALGLGTALGESELGGMCFSRQWLRFALGRLDESDDSGSVRALFEAGQGGTMMIALKQLAKNPQFRLRKIGP